MAGSMEAYNFSAGASITTVHAEREGKGTSAALAKTMAKSVFSIAMNITSGSEEDEEENDEEMASTTGVEMDGLEMIDTEVQSLTDNMNRATAGLKLGSSKSGQEEGGQAMTPMTATTQATIRRTILMTPQTNMTSIQKTTTRSLRCPPVSSMHCTPTNFRIQSTSSSSYGTMRAPSWTA